MITWRKKNEQDYVLEEADIWNMVSEKQDELYALEKMLLKEAPFLWLKWREERTVRVHEYRQRMAQELGE